MTEDLKEGLKKQLIFSADCTFTAMLTQFIHLNKCINTAIENGLSKQEVGEVLAPIAESFEEAIEEADKEFDQYFEEEEV